PERLRALREAGYRGVNLTHPLKEAALGCVDVTSAAATLARSINTVSFEPEGVHGDTTDGRGFLALLAELGVDTASPVVLLGAGGAARSLACALVGAGTPVTLSSRRAATVAEARAV